MTHFRLAALDRIADMPNSIKDLWRREIKRELEREGGWTPPVDWADLPLAEASTLQDDCRACGYPFADVTMSIWPYETVCAPCDAAVWRLLGLDPPRTESLPLLTPAPPAL